MATLQEAEKCPICGHPGNKYTEKPSGNLGNKVLMYRCTNSECRWGKDPEDFGWIVEVDFKGQIPERKPHDKQFPTLPALTAQQERAIEEARQYAQPVDPKDLEPRSR